MVFPQGQTGKSFCASPGTICLSIGVVMHRTLPSASCAVCNYILDSWQADEPLSVCCQVVHLTYFLFSSLWPRDFVGQLCLLGVLAATAMIFHQHNCLNMSWTLIVIDMPELTGESPCVLNPIQRRNNRHLRNAGSQRNSLPQGRAHQLVIYYQVVSPENQQHYTYWVAYI